MKEKDVKIGAIFSTDISFFDHADEKTKENVRRYKTKDNKVFCEIIDVHYSLYGTSYFSVYVKGSEYGPIVVPFGNDISGCKMVLDQEGVAKIFMMANAYMEAMVVNDEQK